MIMKYPYLLGCALGLFSACPNHTKAHSTTDLQTREVHICARQQAPAENLSLWYQEPANNWVTQALPIGGGDFGAMIFGGVMQDHIQFNHKTLWRGSKKSNDLGSYLNFGDLYITSDDTTQVSDYQRSLNLAEATAHVAFVRNGIRFEREYLASFPDKVIAIRYTASKNKALNLHIKLKNAQGKDVTYSDKVASFCGQLNNGMSYFAQMTVEQEGGESAFNNEGIAIRNAKSMVIYLACGTDFQALAPNHITGDMVGLQQQVRQSLNQAQQKGYNKVRACHIADHAALFNRVDFQLDEAATGVATKELLLKQGEKEAYSKALDMLIFQYGRYLTIASSRGVALPSNLQGIWNKDGDARHDAVWASDIHANINVQMNYWPAEPTNLSECHLPFLEYIYNEATRKDGGWQLNARDLGIKRGWVVNTAGNIFGGSSQYKAGKYAVANAWFCEHLWQHFTYTCDTTYLRQTAFPVMKSACEFWFDRLVEAPDGTLECPNEYSPEQGFIQNATAHGQQLVTQLFLNMQQALKVLGDGAADKAFKQELTDKLNRIDRGLRVNDKGLLREWKYQENTPNQPVNQNHFAHDEENIWQCHRHTSHLIALYPGFEIDPGKDKNIFHAAKASLQDRGETGTGWALAWRISLWSRAREAQKAYSLLRHFATHTDVLSYNWYGGLYDNMLDAHATSVFQIEGNFGATAGISEMLLQSRPDSTVLLPALPAEWQEGHIKGLKTIGNFEISLDWKEHRLTKVRIHALKGGPITLAYPGIQSAQVKALRRKAGRRVLHTEQINNKPNQLLLVTKPGETYELIFQ